MFQDIPPRCCGAVWDLRIIIKSLLTTNNLTVHSTASILTMNYCTSIDRQYSALEFCFFRSFSRFHDIRSVSDINQKLVPRHVRILHRLAVQSIKNNATVTWPRPLQSRDLGELHNIKKNLKSVLLPILVKSPIKRCIPLSVQISPSWYATAPKPTVINSPPPKYPKYQKTSPTPHTKNTDFSFIHNLT